MEGHEAGWEGVQRQGQVIGDFLNAFGQGLGGMFHDHMRPATAQISRVYCDGQSASRWSWPWPNARNLGINSSPARLKHDKKTWQPVPKRMISTPDFAIHTIGTRVGQAGAEIGACLEQTQNLAIHALGSRVGQAGAELGACLEQTQLFAMNTVGSRVGQAGADLGACLEQLAGNVLQHLPWPFYRTPSLTLSMSGPSSYTGSVDCVRPAIADSSKVEGGSAERNFLWVSSTSTSSSKSPKYANGPNGQSSHTTDDELDSIISGSPLHKRSSVVVTTTYDSQTQEIESSLVARGDLWRVEASHGGPSTPGSGNAPLFLLQLGPVLFVRDTTILVPVHLSKQHLLWYGFDRKNGLHSLCPAVWSKHRRWLSMSMISLNPISCSFLDLQFPNGQLTYVAGEGVTGSAFLPAFGGLLQAQGRLPGNTKISYFYKNMWGTRFSPGIQLPDKSVSLGILQPLAWQRVGLMLRPAIQMSLTPTWGGRDTGCKAEVIYSPQEKLSWGCGCSMTNEPRAFANVSLGRSKSNGEHTGRSGLVFQVEAPVENVRRASFTVQLNSGVEF
ncbi:hypothetical protein MPTK1_1g17610 [Marchantia polymorpha subsp. ruderalis]|uniref:Uncharacterized protein n=2 Tax=Marchantia polymorpha TaxID=3197 RepID=A0AAF6AR96_MARPO|nr:hypothetical protein MARPO_0001s0101 [Marchantia polymorpha]BBM98966.1 hypothetical protein Mp_1g17610 [Marchantia polymorpha subsp. ruderalis]|eukprot:PTQ50043.1 hypothetical protein MARPO_0001s0101 [Marchantia polymorpha]